MAIHDVETESPVSIRKILEDWGESEMGITKLMEKGVDIKKLKEIE